MTKTTLLIFMSVLFIFTFTLSGCNQQTHVHEWKEATCLTPKTCTSCGETEGVALGHQWKEATCLAPKTCKTCGKTEGMPDTTAHIGDYKCEECTCIYVDELKKFTMLVGTETGGGVHYTYSKSFFQDGEKYELIIEWINTNQQKRVCIELKWIDSQSITWYSEIDLPLEVNEKIKAHLSGSGNYTVDRLEIDLNPAELTANSVTLNNVTKYSSFDNAHTEFYLNRVFTNLMKKLINKTNAELNEVNAKIRMKNFGFINI